MQNRNRVFNLIINYNLKKTFEKLKIRVQKIKKNRTLNIDKDYS